MKTGNTLNRHLRLSAVLFLLIAGALLTTPQDALAQATVSSISFTSDPGTDKTYANGDKVEVTVVFSEAVTVTGTPQLELKFQYVSEKINYKSGSGTVNIVFERALQQWDAPSGIAIEANKLTLNGGTITSANGNATLTHSAVAADSNHKVDASGPGVKGGVVKISSTPDSNSTYVKDEKIQLTIEFDEKAYLDTSHESFGNPYVNLTIGDKTREATYVSGHKSKKFLFEYTVASGDTDTDGIGIGTFAVKMLRYGSAQNATVKDVYGNDGYVYNTTATTSTHKVDSSTSVTPAISSISFTSTPTNSTYKTGDTIEATVTFTKNVTVTGTPQLTLKVGSTDKTADYESGTGTKKLIFEYDVAAGDTDTNGIEIEANKLALNSGTIVDTNDSNRNASLTHTAVAASTSHKVDGVAPTVSGSPSITSTATNSYYKIGDTIQATVTFSEAVTVTGTPQLTLKVGTADKTADYESGTGTTSLVFEYDVASGDTDTDGIEIEASKLALNSGTIKDAAGNAATLTHTALTTQASHKVDGNAPTVSGSPSITSTAQTYGVGGIIQATVTFNEAVTVTGTPQLTLAIGSDNRKANYTSGSPGTALVFEYTVANGDNDTDGISVAANSLALNSGTMKDANGNTATLTHTALATQSTHKVITVVAPKVSTVAITSTATNVNNSTYIVSDKIQATVTYDKSVTVTGTPQLALTIGSTEKNANYKSGSPGTALVFEYTVASGDSDTNGISIAANKLSGTIKDTANSNVNASLANTAVSDQSSHKVDGVVPTIATTNGVRITSTAQTYVNGTKIQATVTFTEAVTVTGTPQLALTIGSSSKNANYKSGSPGTALVFEYTVASGDDDTDGISIAANSLSGTLKDASGNAATLTHAALATQTSHKVITDSPHAVDGGISIQSNGQVNGTYKAGAKIIVYMKFNQSITVTGTPQLTLEIGTADRAASYTRIYSDGTHPYLVFEYTVAAGDVDTDGIEIEANSLSLNGGTIKTANKNAILTHAALEIQTSHKVDGVAPTISGITMHSTPTNSTYKVSDDIEIKVTFTKRVTVTTTSGTPRLTFKIGTADKIAAYTAGTGTQHIRFKYRVAGGDEDTNGISIEANSLELNGGTIIGSIGNTATITHTAVADQSGHKVDGVIPAVTGVAFSSTPASNNSYAIGEKIQITVTFNRNVTVTGTPRLTLQLGPQGGYQVSQYASGSGTKNLVFEYTVAAGNEDTDGVGIEANKLTTGAGGSIKDADKTNATLTHAAVAASTSHKVDGIAPGFDYDTGIGITSSPLKNYTYGVGEKITLTFAFKEKVKVTGTPHLGLTIGATKQNAAYKSGSDTKILTFEYTVQAGDTDTDGVSVLKNQLTLNSGTIKDFVGNPATLTHGPSPATWSVHKVDGVAATVSSLAVTSSAGDDNTYGVGDKIGATVTFNEKVWVTGTPQLTLKIGATETDKKASYKSGSNSTKLVFEYTVASGDNDTDGIAIAANQLTLNSGTITDVGSNPATLTHTALTAQASHLVDTTAPTVATTNGISISSDPGTDNTYATGDAIQATVTFNENVYVTGTPQLKVKIGAFEPPANYKSGSGTKSLVFETTVIAGYEDTNGIEVQANKLSLNSGTIKDTAGNAATLTHTALTAQASHKVDAQAPIINTNGVSIQSSPTKDNTYKKGEKIRVSVTFNDNVYVTGTPQLALNIGTKKQNAAYTSGSTSTILFFEYTVAEGDADTDGISIQSNAIKGGAIKDNVGNDASMVSTTLTTQASHKVDGVSPKIVANGIKITTEPKGGGTYKTGEDIQITATFDDPVWVLGTPKLTVEMGSTDTDVNYLSGSGTTILIFQYTVVEGDEDTDGLGVESDKLALGSETVTIKDKIGNDAILTHAALVTQAAHKVDAVKPTVNSDGITITSNAGADRVYTVGDTIELQVVFSENVTVTNSPQLPLTIGTETKYADYSKGTGTTKLTFAYTVVSGDEDTDGIAIAADSLKLNDGTITDRVGNAATLDHSALTAQAYHKVGAKGPGVDSIAITSTSGNNYYKKGSKLQVTATFNENVTVTGTPTLTLTIGAAYKTASYTSGTGSKKLVFEYTVATDDEDTDGVSIAANQLTLPNGATIKDSNGNNTALTHAAVAGSTSHKVDAKDPTVANNGVSITSTGAPYSVGEKIQATVTFSENVVVTNTPQLTLKVGTSDKKADYASGTGTTKLVFEYKVKSGDTDTDGIEIEANKLALNNGTIADAAGNVAVLDHAALSTQNAHKVDGTAPSIVTDGVSISSGAGTDDTYKTGDKIEATVRFSENVTVTGTPQLTLKIGTADKKSLYTSGVNGGGTTDLVFEYTVAAGDADTDGIEVKANKLALNSGTITDTAGNTATLTHTALATQAKHKVDGVAPTVSKVEITSTPTNNGFYKTGDTIKATVTFSEKITVTGTPQLTLTIGSNDRKADYKSGTGNTALVFAYTVVAGDEDTDGISIASNSLSLNSGTLKDAAGNAATLTHGAASAQGARGAFTAQSTQGVGVAQEVQGAGAAQGAQGAFGAEANFGIQSEPLVSGQSVQTTHLVDGVAPTISSVAITSTPTNSTYLPDDTIEVTVTFSEKVKVTGTPRLGLKIGSATKFANYAGGTGTTAIEFEYTVVTGNSDTNGISIEAGKLELNGGTIKDIAGNAATLTYTALSDQSGHKVGSSSNSQNPSQPIDTTKPTVTSLSITSTGAPYGVGEKIQATVRFSETVVVADGTPQLTLTIGNSDQTVDYASGSGSTALVFRYTVKSSDSSDTDGISIVANSLALNGGTIKDNAGNAATLTHTALTDQALHKVDTTAPTVSSVTITSYPRNNGTYKVDETIQATATFSENVVVTGTPQLTLTIGSTNRKANYTSGSGTKKLVFEYTVQSGDVDTDGISIPANGLAFNGGTIKDAAGNNATLTHSAISAQAVQEARGAVGAGIAMAMGATAQATQTSHKVDGVVPTITSNGISITSTPSSGDTYGLGETIEVTVTFNEKVYVEGNPYLILEVGIADRQANWMRGNDSKTLVFQYTVVSGDTDTNGVSVGGNSLKTNGGTIRDATYNDANLTHNGIQSGHKVLAAANGSLPPGSSPTQSTATISSVALTSTGPYGVWDNIQVRVTTTTPVTVTGSPTLGVIIGNTEKRASYQSGSGTTTLNFQYTVAAGDGDDPNGISVKANSLNGGSITDTASNALNPNYPALPDQGTQHRVDTTAPQVSSITFSSIGPYGIGSYISVTATTSEPVTVTGQQPTLTLVIGSAERQAYLFSRAAMSTSTLVFGYRITAVDKDDKDGISVKGSSLALNGGVIADNAGNMLNLSHSGLSNGGDTQTVGVTVSGINSVAFTSTGPYTVNDAIQVTVSTAEQINVIGAPRIAITVGSDTKYADYVSGSGTTALVFQYTVVAGDTDTDGVEIPQNALENYNSSRMNNNYGTHLVLNHPSVPAAANHIVDTAHPEITEVDFATEGPKVYTAGTTLEVVVTFQETGVQVTPSPSGDMPTLQLLFGSNVTSNSQKTALEARYTGTRAGSTKLIFSYTITSDTPIDTDGAQIEARSLWMPSATSITDANGNAVESIPVWRWKRNRKHPSLVSGDQPSDFTRYHGKWDYLQRIPQRRHR